ncbi:cytochrome c biogenesis protein CcmG, thiol:disulfide interchange protein DsbE [uncultured Thiomicrorhabdus sp.]
MTILRPLPMLKKPLLIWFTEGYAERKSFKHLVSRFNDEGYDIWQIDLLESYFIERSPTNIRKLNGNGIAAVLAHAQTQAKTFIPISTGRMSLVLLRGLRLWQLAEQPTNGYGKMQQSVLFFPNLYNAPEKAGDAPQLFPIVAASSLPITIVQPTEGTFKWKLAELVTALENNNSQVTLASVPNVRDWYFLRRSANEVEKQASEKLVTDLGRWLSISKPTNETAFIATAELNPVEVTERKKGLVPIEARPAVDFELSDTFGESLNFSDKRGKVVLLNFWASWCPPCVKEIPSMNRLAESFDSNQFEIVSVNFKESPQTIRDFLKQVQVDFPVLIDQDGKVSADYEIFSFPSSFLIDTNGQIRYSVNAAIEWDDSEIKQQIQQLINETAQ